MTPPLEPLHWSTEGIVHRRERHFAASQRAFVPYRKPLIFQRGHMQHDAVTGRTRR